MADLFRLSASEAAARIREGKLTSEALVRSCLERIDARESQVKMVHLDRDFAVAQARERAPERQPRSDSRSAIRCQGHHGHGRPAHRVRISIYKANCPMADAACVALSRAAGGVLWARR